MCFVFIYENRRMKSVEVVLRGGEREEGEWWSGWIQLRYILNTYANIRMYTPVYLLYVNKITKAEKAILDKERKSIRTDNNKTVII
jgi:hypothetical protein